MTVSVCFQQVMRPM